MDEPIADPAAMTTYLVCEAAAKKSKVILSGVGADEIFGGYPRYLANSISNYYCTLFKSSRKYSSKCRHDTTWIGLCSKQ